MNEAFVVEINERIEHGFEHFASFGCRERTLGENLREIFLGIFHHDIEKIHVSEAAAARAEQAKQIRMSELRGAAPHGKLKIGGSTRGDEFDGGFLSGWIGELGEEDGGIIRAAQVLLKREIVFNDLTFALLPGIGHIAPPTTNSCSPRTETLPFTRCTTGERARRRLRQGWGDESSDSQAPGAGRSSSSFWHEMRRKGECDAYRLYRRLRRGGGRGLGEFLFFCPRSFSPQRGAEGTRRAAERGESARPQAQ